MRVLFTLLLLMTAGWASAQEFGILPQSGNKYVQMVNATTPMGSTQVYVTQTANVDSDSTVVFTTGTSISMEAPGKEVSVTYLIANGEYVVSVKDVLAENLAQMGGTIKILEATDLRYPVQLVENTELPPASMKIQAKIQGLDLEMLLSIKERKVLETEEIVTPAGTFECIKVVEKQVISLMGQEQVSEITNWYGKGTGSVKMRSSSMGGLVSVESLLQKVITPEQQ